MTELSVSGQDLHELVRSRLAERDIRYTGGRREVVKAMLRATGPRSAADLCDRIDGVPLSSLYRTLTVLDEVGVVQKHHDADGVARFELAEWLAGHHHHVVCLGCGLVEDVELGAESERLLDEVASELARSAGFGLEGHVLEVEGLCAGCRT